MILNSLPSAMLLQVLFCKITPFFTSLFKQGIFGTASHIIMSLESMNKQIQDEFEEKLKMITERVTELCKLEKEAWLKLEKFDSKNYTL